MILETERLYLRELHTSDLSDLKKILQDKDVVYAYEHTFSDDDVKEWLQRQIDRYHMYGFGLWAVIHKDSGMLIGQSGLSYQTCENCKVLEIGYLFKKAYWHQGYATEAAQACKNYAFTTLHAPSVHAIIKTDNIPSINVAKAIGMRQEKEFITRYYHGDMTHYLYSCYPK